MIQIANDTNKEEVYLVGHNQKEQELSNYINKRVAVKGKILRGNDGNPFVLKNCLILTEDVAIRMTLHKRWRKCRPMNLFVKNVKIGFQSS